MGLLSYDEWKNSTHESSAITRSKTAAAYGLGPDVADVFGHSTPPPWQVEKLLAKNKKFSKKKKKEEDPTEPLEENKGKSPNYAFDRFVQKAKKASDDIDKEIEDANKENDRLDKEISKKRQSKLKKGQDRVPPHPSSDDGESEEPGQSTNPYIAARAKKGSKAEDPKTSSVEKPDTPKKKLSEEQLWEALLDTSYDYQK